MTATAGGADDDVVTSIVRAGGRQVAGLLERVEALLHEVAAGAGQPLAVHAQRTIEAGGKRLRPLLVILAAGDVAAGAADGLVRAAAAVELVHSATLVHDDVLDDAALRRGRPTVHAVAGRGAATHTGDLLFARAFSLLVANGGQVGEIQVRTLSEAGFSLARGELLQRADAWDAGITVERYLRRCELKTARLFEAACALGALEAERSSIARADQEGSSRVASLRGFGRRIGLAFQILDDVLDVSGPSERTGKNRGTDLLDGTVTLPFILARARDPSLAALDPRAVRDAAQAEEICDRIAATGALDASRAQALEHVAQAKSCLPADLPARERDALRMVADGVVDRYS